MKTYKISSLKTKRIQSGVKWEGSPDSSAVFEPYMPDYASLACGLYAVVGASGSGKSTWVIHADDSIVNQLALTKVNGEFIPCGEPDYESTNSIQDVFKYLIEESKEKSIYIIDSLRDLSLTEFRYDKLNATLHKDEVIDANSYDNIFRSSSGYATGGLSYSMLTALAVLQQQLTERKCVAIAVLNPLFAENSQLISAVDAVTNGSFVLQNHEVTGLLRYFGTDGYRRSRTTGGTENVEFFLP